MDELLKERLELACGRVEEIAREHSAAEPFGEYFRQVAGFLLEMIGLRGSCREKRRKTEEPLTNCGKGITGCTRIFCRSNMLPPGEILLMRRQSWAGIWDSC